MLPLRDGYVCASVPHHITAAFMPVWGKSPRSTGSIGVGIAVEPRLELCYNLGLSGSVTGTAAKLLKINGVEPGSVRASNPLPWGFGYATSGASGVAAAHITSYLKGRKLLALLEQAHEIELQDKTGLGDVLAISCGIGLVMRTKPGPPGIGAVDCIYMPRSVSVITVEAGSMSTEQLLSSLNEGFYKESAELLRRLSEDFSLSVFIESVKGLNDKLRLPASVVGDEGYERIKGTPGLLSYYVKKRLVVLLVESDRIADAVEYLRTKLPGYTIRELSPSTAGPYII